MTLRVIDSTARQRLADMGELLALYHSGSATFALLRRDARSGQWHTVCDVSREGLVTDVTHVRKYDDALVEYQSRIKSNLAAA